MWPLYSNKCMCVLKACPAGVLTAGSVVHSAATHGQCTGGNMSNHNWAQETAQFISSALIAMAFQNETSSSVAKYRTRGEEVT